MSEKPSLIGILGGGQLGQMLALAGIPLGFRFRVWDPAPDCCARLCAEHVCAEYDDSAALERFVEGLDLVTFEFENVPAETLRAIESRVRVSPSCKALQISQDRLLEKQFFAGLNIPLAEFVEVNSETDLANAMKTLNSPAILKSRRFGYDGKGQLRLQIASDPKTAWSDFGEKPAVLERMLAFEREVSCLAARNADGEIAFYPLFENTHEKGILRRTVVPASTSPELEQQAQNILAQILDELDYCGLLTIEFFIVNGQLIVNEMAPRVHNSGHLTIEAFHTSQFEQHLRAVAGLPLGSTALRSPSVMVNCIGSLPPSEAVLRLPGAAFHDYGKPPRPGRKVGHITLQASSLDQCLEKATFIESLSETMGGTNFDSV